MLKYIILFLLIIDIGIIICANNDDKSEDDFIPTHEWQVVRKGQKIPKGLHIRVNLKTGLTEAKLVDENEKDNNALLEVPQDIQDEDDELLNPDVIKKALKKMKNDLNSGDGTSKKNPFRSYEDIKKELDSLNLIPRVDAEILNDLFTQHMEEIKKVKINTKSVVRILEDFDYLAHQFDNALEFVKLNGFKEIIYKDLNVSDSQIKQETLKLFGSLVQNNAQVQIHALETGAIGVLLRILNLDSAIQVKSRAVHAISCLLRRFPLAQLKFVENGGLSVVAKILEKDPVKIQIKMVTLMNDLLVENLLALQDSSNENQEIVSQYKLVNLENLLLEQGWCEYLNKLLYSLIATDQDDHDLIEKCIVSMHTLTNKCASHYSKDLLTTLREKYKKLALYDTDNELNNSDFFTILYELCGDILLKKTVKSEL